MAPHEIVNAAATIRPQFGSILSVPNDGLESSMPEAKAMTEDKAKEIHNATDLSVYTHDEFREADAWVKGYALQQLSEWLKEDGRQCSAVGDYVLLMARCHYGSVETDEFLRTLGCYPEWLAD